MKASARRRYKEQVSGMAGYVGNVSGNDGKEERDGKRREKTGGNRYNGIVSVNAGNVERCREQARKTGIRHGRIRSERLAGKLHDAELNTKKLHAWTKFPDAAITFGAIGSALLPSVIVEVGFTEIYADLALQ